ncbi:MAG: hypothetical protein ACREBU_25100 [Nitrososphaera sp.]
MTPELGALLGVLGAVLAVYFIRWAYSTGWKPLHSRFPTTVDSPTGELRFKSMSIRLPFYVHLNFGFCTAVKLTDQAIQILIHPPFGIFFRPVSLPWVAIKDVDLRRSVFGYQVAAVQVKDYSGVLLFYFALAQVVFSTWRSQRGANAFYEGFAVKPR